MKIKFIQVNIYKGKYLDPLVDFLLKEAPDFVAMQEVTWGKLNKYPDSEADLFDILGKKLSMKGVFRAGFELSDAKGSMGNAVFTKHEVLNSKQVILKEFERVTFERSQQRSFFPDTPRVFLDAVCKIAGKEIHVMSWHGAWTAPPADTEETVRQAKLIADYLGNLKDKIFILGSDTNNLIDSKTIGIINNVSNNLLADSKLKGTLNLDVHYNAPNNYLIDFVFTSKNVKRIKVEVPQVTVSDHLPVVCELEI